VKALPTVSNLTLRELEGKTIERVGLIDDDRIELVTTEGRRYTIVAESAYVHDEIPVALLVER
jgi:hypothetical protein